MHKATDCDVFTREQLQNMRATVQQEDYEKNVGKVVHIIREAVLQTAMRGDRQYHFHPIPSVPQRIPNPRDIIDASRVDDISACFIWAQHPTETRKKLIDDTIAKLQDIFPDVTITYIHQTCVLTGKSINDGIQLDWRSPHPSPN